MREGELRERLAWAPPVPADLAGPYRLKDYPEAQVIRIADKYLDRTHNLKRAWVRILNHLPETLEGAPLDILEFSTAHGAMLEVWRHFGHRVRGTDWGGWPADYAKKPTRQPWLDAAFAEAHDHPRAAQNLGWIYQPLIEAAGLDVDLFDASERPYPYADKSVDVICCYQALDAYGAPSTWVDIVREFCRIARRSIVIGFNPPPKALRNDAAHQAEVRQALEDLRAFDQDGFQAVFMEFGTTNAGHHPTALKLVAQGGAPMLDLQLKKTSPKGDTYYRRRAQTYEKRRRKQAWWHVEQDEMRSLLETLPRGLSVVDIPFGTGRFVRDYVDLGYDISGLDASADMLAAAKDALGPLFDTCNCVVGDAADLPFEDGQFDLIVSTRFLRDIVPFGKAKEILAEMARVTSGHAIIQLGENPVGDVQIGEDDVMGGALSRTSVDTLLRNHGLEPLERRLVKSTPEVGDIHMILCRKIADAG